MIPEPPAPSLIVNPCFSGADGGSYDVVNDASSPAARECCAQQSSARHNWEMNYQEAAIYLQVSPAGSWGLWSAGNMVVLGCGKQTTSVLRLKIRCFAKDSASGVGRCWRHLQIRLCKSFGATEQRNTHPLPVSRTVVVGGLSTWTVLPPWHGDFCSWS